MTRFARFVPLLSRSLPLVLAALCWPAPEAGADEVLFNRDIRPILAENCFQCHGPDANQRQADLRLDEQQAAVGPDGPVVAGKPEDSELLRRVTSGDEAERMPPPDVGKRLSPQQIDKLRQWIAAGATWQRHWSLNAPRPSEPPQVDSDRALNDVDRFLLRRLEREQLGFSPEADRRTLIRRLYFDLTGLPPTPAEVDAFVQSDDPQAYEKVVDRLLESPHYGERMAIYWLDLVRYADTNGIHGDNHREHWLYRDYVINAFNDNMPFDRFTIEQLAGDLLPEPTSWQRIASGYNRLNMTTREGGAQAKEYMAKYAADRVRNASTVWMGATLGCAECHDHKFDPYSTRDFYQFAAFFADVQETAVGRQQPTKIPTEEQQAELGRIDRQLAETRKILETPTDELAASLRRWEQNWQQAGATWQPLAPAEIQTEGTKLTAAEDDPALLAAAEAKDTDQFRLKFTGGFEHVTALRLEALPHDSLPAKGPGTAGNGNFVVNELRLTVDGQPAAFGKVTATHSQEKWPAAKAADGDASKASGWAILPQVGKPQQLVLPLAEPADGGELQVEIEMRHGGEHLLGRFRLSVTSAEPPPAAGQQLVPEPIRELLRKQPEDRSDAEQKRLADWYRTIAPELRPARQRLAELQAQRDKVMASAPEVLVTTAGKPRTMRILPRGNWLDDSGPVVEPQIPEFLGPLPSEQRLTRLDLANWLVDPDNPFTARVMVNRLWKLAFGRGIVRTLDDFGTQGRWPTHPELLDQLAIEFVDSGWDVKHMLRLLVNSAAYRQSSAADSQDRQRDPYNQLYARQSRFRLDAEMVRDNALAVSGLLVDKLGGPSVKPYQPAGYWSHLNFPKRTYQADEGENQHRRGLYTYWCRTFLHPSLLAFDATTREECAVERPRSNTPLAALVLLNDPTYVEAARVLAASALREEAEPRPRLQWLFRRVLAREPSEREASVLLPIIDDHLRQYEKDPQAADSLLQTGIAPRDQQLDAAEHAAWTTGARVLLNLHETITRN